MMIDRNKPFTEEDLENNPPSGEHLTYRNSLEVALLEEWQDYGQTLEDAMNFIEVTANELRNMIRNGTTWEELTKYGQQAAEEFEFYQDKIQRMF